MYSFFAFLAYDPSIRPSSAMNTYGRYAGIRSGSSVVFTSERRRIGIHGIVSSNISASIAQRNAHHHSLRSIIIIVPQSLLLFTISLLRFWATIRPAGAWTTTTSTSLLTAIHKNRRCQPTHHSTWRMATSSLYTNDKAYIVHPNLRGVFCGSGSDGLAHPDVTKAILELCINDNNNNEPVQVVYLGTATYDLPQFCQRQTDGFLRQRQAAGCQVTALNVVDQALSPTELEETLKKAHVVVVGGGNTLFAMDRWERIGLAELLRKYALRGDFVLAGGSAGAICWFTLGHSDSMDPDTYKTAMLAKFGATIDQEEEEASHQTNVVEESSILDDDTTKKEWPYICVSGLGIFPGLLCPHHDRIQSNGVLRADDFDAMLLERYQHQQRLDGDNNNMNNVSSKVVGIGIDHWAALVVEGEGRFRVLSLEGKQGSVVHGGPEGGTTSSSSFSQDNQGIPGVWIKTVEQDGWILARVCPTTGHLADIFKNGGGATTYHESSKEIKLLQECRRANPDDGPVVVVTSR